ncbi:Uncharacterised protein [Klebsiella variicola]|uniref:Uncharacterized protein n=1 Tax=Klebsiella variicola TaxID=244366 RepID=A0A7H4MD91_KLEVA|nr:Uncharacterised protein [Klebsiella variicola]
MPIRCEALLLPLNSSAGGAIPDNPPFGDHYRARRDACGIFHAVGDHQQSELLLLADIGDQGQHLLTQRRVKR